MTPDDGGRDGRLQLLDRRGQEAVEYATNPLWQVVDGPWKLSDYRTDGYAAFVPNTNYSGPVKPTLDKFIEQPFTTAQAELNVLRSGNDRLRLPAAVGDRRRRRRSRGRGTPLSPWVSWGINYSPFNFANPTTGPIFKQLYVRQAMQSADQPAGVREERCTRDTARRRTGRCRSSRRTATSAPTRRTARTSTTRAKAIALLKSHGWTIHPDGASVPHRPTAARE